MPIDTPHHQRSPVRRHRALAVVVVAVGGLLAGMLGLGAPTAQAQSSGVASPGTSGDNQPCLDNVGITVVVDFGELGGGVNVRCAPGPVTDGFDALTKAGISFQTTTRFAGFLCKIAGEPADDPCINTSPGDAYWSYWVAPRGGQWCYSNLGAGNRTRPLPPGSIEGWSFSKDKQSTTNNPPRYRPPEAIPGQTPSQIPKSDCDGTVPSPPNPGPPVTSPPTTTGPPAGNDGGSTGGSSGGDPAGNGSASPDLPSTDPNGDPASTGDMMDATVAAGGTPGDAPSAEDATGSDIAIGLVSTNADGSTEALGDVDLASDGSPGGSALAVGLVGVAAVAFAAVGVVVVRRRRAAGMS